MKRRHLSLDGADMALDTALMARMPREVAVYYLALPLASEDGALSVAMAHPENETALMVLGDLFGAPIVPVHVRTETLHCMLRRHYKEMPGSTRKILCWSAEASDTRMVAHLAAAFAAPNPDAVTTLASNDRDLETVLEVIRSGNFGLAVLAPPPKQPLARFSEQSPASLLLLGSKEPRLPRALVTLRGYASDRHMLDQLSPLLQLSTYVTLLPLLQSDQEEALRLVPQNGSGKRHLHRCLQHAGLNPAHTFVRFRQGPAIQQVVDELRQEAYDLVAISAEGNGHFVSGILATIEKQGLHRDRAFFILKPPAPET